MFWVLKRTLSLRHFYEYPQHMFWLRNKKNKFSMLIYYFTYVEYPQHMYWLRNKIINFNSDVLFSHVCFNREILPTL